MCIICVHTFDNLATLSGYTVDRERLAECFLQIGFEVYLAEAKSNSEHCLTAKVNRMSDETFA